ncbi:unnamed protein product [Arabis nemorensis]|uniref:Uncharacterized protein n=1 Tax=Arabis nemorensis TaxID=586526 RepID=A0A565CSQ7_9BRAS|nr:unnamed protein product [Arabis nemorensis]
MTPVLQLGHVGVENDGWGDWYDQDRDRSVLYMHGLIMGGYVFEKTVWPGGIVAVDYVHLEVRTTDVEHERHVVDRKGKSVAVKEANNVNMKQKSKKLKKSASRRKQQRIETYFEPVTRVAANLKGWMESQLDEVKNIFLKEVADHRKEIERGVSYEVEDAMKDENSKPREMKKVAREAALKDKNVETFSLRKKREVMDLVPCVDKAEYSFFKATLIVTTSYGGAHVFIEKGMHMCFPQRS